MKQSVLRARRAVLRVAGPASVAVVLMAAPAAAQWIGEAAGDGAAPPAAAPQTLAPAPAAPAAASPAAASGPAPTAITVAPPSTGGAGGFGGGFDAPGGFSPAPGMGGGFGAPGMGAPGMGAPAPDSGRAAQTARCQSEINPLREDLESRGEALQVAAKKKRPPSELCPLFRRLSGAYDKFYGYLTKNKSTCGVPDDVLKTLKKSSTQVAGTRDKVCEIAAAGGTGGGPTGPAPLPQGMLSSGLNLPSGLPSVNSDRPGGVYDTLGGSALR